MKSLVQSGSSLNLDVSCIANRPMTADGLPAIGRSEGIAGLYIAVMHSGVTLAPLIGRLVSNVIVEGHRSGMREPYTVRRFS